MEITIQFNIKRKITIKNIKRGITIKNIKHKILINTNITSIVEIRIEDYNLFRSIKFKH